MIGQVLNTLFTLQTVFEDEAESKSICSYYLSPCVKEGSYIIL